MKEKIIKVVVNGVIGMLTSIATIYLGASAGEAVVAGGTASGLTGEFLSNTVLDLVGGMV